jgi:hypothetical protein
MSDQNAVQFDFVVETGFPADANFIKARTVNGLRYLASASWPCVIKDPFTLDPAPDIVDEINSGVFRCLWIVSNEIAVSAWVGYGNADIKVAAVKPEQARAGIESFRGVLPRHEPKDKGRIPVTFWSYTPEGPHATRRDLLAPTWAEIEGNYAAEAVQRLGPLMQPDYRPGRSGQLVLWHGEPGTGKTTALRALGQAWKDWAEIHYITDPDQFFGSHADYMLQVMLGAGSDEDEEDLEDGEAPAKWRLLVLEDAGELLAKDAKSEVGAALSRFLNSVDGLIGQGLRVMTMVTTNEELGDLNEAVTRHGRAASEVHFARLSVVEAANLLEKLADFDAADQMPAQSHTLASIYALAERRDGGRPKGKAKVGFA